MSVDRDYYCSYKFKFLKIDLESKQVLNCHASRPHKVDFNWLGKNPGQLFNDDINVHERKQMLANERNSSCEQNCWFAEDRGSMSPRLSQNGLAKTHLDPITQPEIIDLTIGGDCNLTCSYCCKEYSSAWRRDLNNNGFYPLQTDSDRYRLTPLDQVLLNVGQKDLKATDHYQTLLNEVKLAAPTLKELIVTGGEPLLDNQLIKNLADLKLQPDAKVYIYTGLGLSASRFDRLIPLLQAIPNLCLILSGENTEKFLEFNRYGIVWEEYLAKIDLLVDKKIDFIVHATITNLTIFDFVNFYKKFHKHIKVLAFAFQPRMMAIHMLDPTSKQHIRDTVTALPTDWQEQILQSIDAEPEEQCRQDLAVFLQEFTSRRTNISYNIFPKSFLDWLGLEHVVQ
jgi:organic radical activating enzyme